MYDHVGRRLVALIIVQSFMLIMHYYNNYYSRDETAVRNYKLANFLNSADYTKRLYETNIIILYTLDTYL